MVDNKLMIKPLLQISIAQQLLRLQLIDRDKR